MTNPESNAPDSVTQESVVEHAVEAFRRGFTPVPIRAGSKAPYGSGWQNMKFASEEQVRASFKQYAAKGAPGLGIALGAPSNGLVDVDIDHPAAWRLRHHFLPSTPMESGRPGNAHSHRWYIDKNFDPNASESFYGLQALRRYHLPSKEVTIEYRSTGGQSVVPPTIWYPKKGMPGFPEQYWWESPDRSGWGGEQGPAIVDGRELAVQVVLTHLGAVLLDAWPGAGSRHDAYLALAGGLLRFGDDVHPFWEQNLPVLIDALAQVTNDDDASTRVSETMGSTLKKLRAGDKVQGFPSLAEIIGNDHAEAARRAAREVEQLAGFDPSEIQRAPDAGDRNAPDSDGWEPLGLEDEELPSTLEPLRRNPMEERSSSWEMVDLGPYFAGQIEVSKPTILRREDGHGLFYEGRVNMLFGSSESAKTWITMFAAAQQVGIGERVTFLDLEDDPQGVVDRLRRIGVAADDARTSFAYIHPEAVIASMQRGKFGPHVTPEGEENAEVFKRHLDHFDPTLIIVDGMTMLYGLHGLDTNDAAGTDVIKSWLFSLTRSGRTTVIVIDHTGKNAGPGASPLGAHHKIAMIQGSALRADAVVRPMPGKHGQVRLTVYKDRLGEVRKVSSLVTGNGDDDAEQTCGTVHLDSTQDGVTRMWVDTPSGTEITISMSKVQQRAMQERDQKDSLRSQVLALFGGDMDRELKTPDLIAAGLTSHQAYNAWNLLVGEKHLEVIGTTRNRRYRLYDPDRTARENEIEQANNRGGRA